MPSHPVACPFEKDNQADYYAHLNGIREQGGWVAWFAFFLIGVSEVAEDAVGTARRLHRLISSDRAALLSQRSSTLTALQLFEKLPQHPAITMPLVMELLSTTKPTAGKAIEVLLDQGVLEEVGDRKRARLYCYQNYLRALG